MTYPSESDNHLSVDHPLADGRLEINLLTGKGLEEYYLLQNNLALIVTEIRAKSQAAQRRDECQIDEKGVETAIQRLLEIEEMRTQTGEPALDTIAVKPRRSDYPGGRLPRPTITTTAPQPSLERPSFASPGIPTNRPIDRRLKFAA
jgi:hypothetical protein